MDAEADVVGSSVVGSSERLTVMARWVPCACARGWASASQPNEAALASVVQVKSRRESGMAVSPGAYFCFGCLPYYLRSAPSCQCF